VERPLAGGHLGFGIDDWAKYDLRSIVTEIQRYLRTEILDIPLIPAGGIFTGRDAVSYLDNDAAAVQVAMRFTTTRECGLPARHSAAFNPSWAPRMPPGKPDEYRFSTKNGPRRGPFFLRNASCQNDVTSLNHTLSPPKRFSTVVS
jgi:hypothetical protein